VRPFQRRAGGATLTFLFADLREYTSFVEEHGDAAATALIKDFRRVVRAQLAVVGGGEIKTEGDSFYLVFTTAHGALQCAVAILNEAEHATSAYPTRPMSVGIGIHAGEPVELERQFVGSAVNLAARLGSAAQSGELLISETVRGLLRTSGMPPLTERPDLSLKGIRDAPRAYAVDWRQMEYLSASGGDAPTDSPLLSRRVLITGAGALVVAGSVAALLRPRAQGTDSNGAGATVALVALPSHGPLIFDLERTPAGSERVAMSFNDPAHDRIRFTGSAVEFSVSAGSWISMSVKNLSPDDFVADFLVAPIDGEGTIAFWFRGGSGRQDQVRLAPLTGELTVQVVRSFESDAAPVRLFGPATRVPPSRIEERALAVSAHGRDIVVLSGDSEVARVSDTAAPSGALGVVANATPGRALTIELRRLRVFGP
jgi:class 3 adenylate cyclase